MNAPSTQPLDVVQLAMKIADEDSRALLEMYGDVGTYDDSVWYDLASPIDPELIPIADVEQAIRYLELRGEDLPFLMIRHGEAPHLIRFEARA